MHCRTFVTHNVVGALLWGAGVTVLGYSLGQITFVQESIEVILIGIVGLLVTPIAFELLRSRRGARRDARYDEPQESLSVAAEQVEA